jgi:hypothetical protein
VAVLSWVAPPSAPQSTPSSRTRRVGRAARSCSPARQASGSPPPTSSTHRRRPSSSFPHKRWSHDTHGRRSADPPRRRRRRARRPRSPRAVRLVWRARPARHRGVLRAARLPPWCALCGHHRPERGRRRHAARTGLPDTARRRRDRGRHADCGVGAPGARPVGDERGLGVPGVLATVGASIAFTGPGSASVDNALDLDWSAGWSVASVALGVGAAFATILRLRLRAHSAQTDAPVEPVGEAG